MSQTYISFIVSHQARIRCIMNKYGFGIMTGGGPAKSGEVASFKNAAVIRLEITKETVKASLVVSGIIDPTENKASYTYFVRPDEIGKSGADYTEISFKDDTKKNEFHDDVGDDTYVFYLVRHGQAEHNVLTGASKTISYKDTSLTPSGIKQANESGTELSKIIKEYPDFLFASDLQRTRQTMLELIRLFTLDNKKIIILPCAHELKYKYDSESKSCDAKQGKTPNENISKSANCKTPGSKNQTNDDDWGPYCDFYGNSTRASWFRNPDRKSCRDTDMITQAITIIKEKSSETSRKTIRSDESYETSREAILPGSNRPDDLVFGGRRHKSRKVKARHAKKTRHTRKHLTKKKIHSNKRKGRKTRNKNKK
jgi:bisphosphoglycerate-dependent phosphoglycerate mutase